MPAARVMHRRLEQSATAFKARIAVEMIASMLARRAGIDPDAIALRNTGRHAVRSGPARPALFREAIYFAVTRMDVRQGAVAHALGISRQAVNQATIEVERCREDDPQYDRRLDEIEIDMMGAA